MGDRPDGRAIVALAFGLASLLVLVTPGAGVFFGLLGTILAGASVISTDGPPTRSTRRVAVAAVLLASGAVVVGVAIALSIPQG
jgi:hypothetical protein